MGLVNCNMCGSSIDLDVKPAYVSNAGNYYCEPCVEHYQIDEFLPGHWEGYP